MTHYVWSSKRECHNFYLIKILFYTTFPTPAYLKFTVISICHSLQEEFFRKGIFTFYRIWIILANKAKGKKYSFISLWQYFLWIFSHLFDFASYEVQKFVCWQKSTFIIKKRNLLLKKYKSVVVYCLSQMLWITWEILQPKQLTLTTKMVTLIITYYESDFLPFAYFL